MNVTVVVQTDDLDSVARAFAETVKEWDCDIPIRQASPGDLPEEGRKAIDPVAVAALVMSIPSAALAVMDLTDRIRKRRRADRLIRQAKALRTANGTTAFILVGGGNVPLDTMSPDELIDLVTKQEG